MISERACSHSACGLARRSAVSPIHSMSPYQPWPTATSSFSRRSGRAVAEVMPKASNPSFFARVRISDTIAWGLEVEVGIAGMRRHRANAGGEQGAKRRPRLDPCIPMPRFDRGLPGDVAQIVERAQMRRERKVGVGHRVAGEPLPRREQPVEVEHVLVVVGLGLPLLRWFGRRARGVALVVL